MLILIGLTGIAVLLVIQNSLSLLIGIKALPSSSKVSQFFTTTKLLFMNDSQGTSVTYDGYLFSQFFLIVILLF